MRMLLLAAFLIVGLCPKSGSPLSPMFQSIDGSNNNVLNTTFGAFNSPFIRRMRYVPISETTTRPSARKISSQIFGLKDSVMSTNTVNALTVFFVRFQHRIVGSCSSDSYDLYIRRQSDSLNAPPTITLD
jgi:hypothetical protein